MSQHAKLIESEAEFQSTIQAGVVLADFFATWCGPCKMQSPILDEVASTIGDKARIIKVDTDKFPSLATEYEVASIPTIVVLKNGRVIDRYVGLQQANTLKSALENAAS